ETVKKVERLLYVAEYKRRQSAPGVKVTRRSFGRDRRYPIVNKFRDAGREIAAKDDAFYKSKGPATSAEAFDF
ncbi:MAG: NAD+ synthase, partial [Beijerinckiaceae bacterium]